MSDDLTKKRPQDASKINIHEAWELELELEYWSTKLRATKQQLIQAVAAVGIQVDAVEFYLGYHSK